PWQRQGRDFLQGLQAAQVDLPMAVPVGGPACDMLARASYVQSVCWMGACLADALHYAQEHGLVHLDLKPANVLLAADGQPMLLDFHMARAPIRRDGPLPDWLGGTPAYMAPEQRRAFDALRQGQRVPQAVDGRADVYSMGLLLYEALSGKLPAPTEK